ncbi:MAG: ATP-binding protein [Roseburia sp.]|nr:ATP-binding protein [Roseburia sp.]
MKNIERADYISHLKDLQGTPDIKIITGIRRSGKSELMKAYIEYLKETDKNANIIFIDFFDMRYDEIKEYRKLNAYVENLYIQGKNNYVFIDEVQLCEKFEIAVNSFYTSKKYDIYITGSNAFLLSGDLSTLFTGRYIEIHVLPFSFKEYCLYYSDETNTDKLFEEYIVKGGLAGSYVYKTEHDRVRYIQEVYNTIISRDLITKYAVADTYILEHLSEYLMDNISNLTSPNKVTDTLKSNKVSASHTTIGKYLKYLCNAFMFYDVKRYDIKGKKYLTVADKFYLADVGIRYAILGSKNLDFGRLYENVVYLELLRRGYEVYVGTLYQKEIDFIAKRGNEKIYIQVSDNISHTETFEREYSPLLSIKDAYPKMIIARTRHDEYSYEGIRIVDIADWLLNK